MVPFWHCLIALMFIVPMALLVEAVKASILLAPTLRTLELI